MEIKGKRVFITGATGFIGNHLCRRLQELGANVSILVHTTKYSGNYVPQFLGDLTDMNTGWNNLINMFQPEIVFHLAAQPLVTVASINEFETLDVNVRGTYNLLNVCKSIRSIKSFVHISTDKVYGDVSPITKDTPLNGVMHPYNASKMAADYLAQMYSNFFNIPMVIVRNANVYGAGDIHFDRVVPGVIRKIFLEEHPIIRGDGTNTRDFIHVSEIVEGYIKASTLPYKNNLTALTLPGINYSVQDVVDTLLMKMNHVDLCPIYESVWTGEIPHQHIINDTAKELIGWNPQITLDAGLDLTIPWYTKYLFENYS